MKTEKKVLLALLLAFLVFGSGLIWSAGGQEGGKVRLTHYGHTQPPFDGLIQRNIDNLMADNPNIEVEYALFADPDLPDQLMTAFAGGEPPDSFTIADMNAATFLERELVAPIDPEGFGVDTIEEVVAMWDEGAFEGTGAFYRGEYYGVPHEYSNYSAWINTEHMREAGLDPEKDIPKTWEEFTEVGKKLTIDEGGTRVRNGFGVNLKTAGFVANVSYPLLAGKGVGLVDDDVTKSMLDTPEAVEAVTTFTDWILEDEIWDPGLVTDDREGFGTELLSMFLTGGAWYWGVMESEYPDVYDNAEVIPYPRFADGEDVGGISYGYATFVSAPSENQKEAWMVADAIASTPNDFIREGLFQPRIGPDGKGYDENLPAEELPSWDVFGAELPKATSRPLTSKYEEVIDAYYSAVTSIVYDDAGVEDALNEAAANINRLLQD